jgi:hypothetical protein
MIQYKYMEEEDHSLKLNSQLSCCCNGNRVAALGSTSLLFSSHSLHSLSSTLSQFYSLTVLLSWCLFIGKNCGCINGLHHFVNGWCNYHCSLLTMVTLLLRVGCTSYCPLNDNILTITPFDIYMGNCPLASSAQACILQLFQAYHSESVSDQVYRYLPHLSITSHQSTPFLT